MGGLSTYSSETKNLVQISSSLGWYVSFSVTLAGPTTRGSGFILLVGANSETNENSNDRYPVTTINQPSWLWW